MQNALLHLTKFEDSNFGSETIFLQARFVAHSMCTLVPLLLRRRSDCGRGGTVLSSGWTLVSLVTCQLDNDGPGIMQNTPALDRL